MIGQLADKDDVNRSGKLLWGHPHLEDVVIVPISRPSLTSMALSS